PSVARGERRAPVRAEGGERLPRRRGVAAARPRTHRLTAPPSLHRASSRLASSAARTPLLAAPSIVPDHAPPVCSPQKSTAPNGRASTSARSSEASSNTEYEPRQKGSSCQDDISGSPASVTSGFISSRRARHGDGSPEGTASSSR